MSRKDNKEKKLAVLELVKEKKQILFGSFQKNAISKTEKEEAWRSILKKAQSLGLSTADKQWTYARDHLFGLWKSRALAKRDNPLRTGTGGGKSVVMDEVDKAILDIIKKDSDVAEGLVLPESNGVATCTTSLEAQENITRDKSLKRPKERPIAKKHDMEEIKIMLFDSKFYLNKLKILKLERELGLEPSKFTKEIRQRN